jgi:uncharacterized protein YodC (DUF2158 family)
MGGCGVNIGEVVRFKGFGPKMTVSEVWSKNIVRCQWFEGTELREGWYPVENLGVVAQDEEELRCYIVGGPEVGLCPERVNCPACTQKHLLRNREEIK